MCDPSEVTALSRNHVGIVFARVANNTSHTSITALAIRVPPQSAARVNVYICAVFAAAAERPTRQDMSPENRQLWRPRRPLAAGMGVSRGVGTLCDRLTDGITTVRSCGNLDGRRAVAKRIATETSE